MFDSRLLSGTYFCATPKAQALRGDFEPQARHYNNQDAITL